jgi:hypothetical protein
VSDCACICSVVKSGGIEMRSLPVELDHLTAVKLQVGSVVRLEVQVSSTGEEYDCVSRPRSHITTISKDSN